MKKKLNTFLGFYSPGFMRMHVGTNLSLSNFQIINDDYTESIFLHEYVHFIQDLTSVYGLYNINLIVDYLKFVNNEIIKNPPSSFSVPVLPFFQPSNNVFLNDKLANIHNGNGDDEIADFLSHRTGNISVMNRNIPTVEVTYNDENGISKIFEFGALCVLESMAYIIESECYSNCEPSPDLPYKSAEKLVELIYPSFGSDRLNILALCDVSLQVFHPGEFFYNTLLKMKNNSISFTKPEDIYGYCTTITPTFNYNGATNFVSLINQQKSIAIRQVNSYFNDPAFSLIKNWLGNMINQSVTYRLANPTFIIDIARGNKLSSNNAFNNFYLNTGTPVMTNDLGEAFLYDSSGTFNLNYPLIWAIDQIHQVFWGNQTNCELTHVCKAGGINVDKRCSISPWTRANDKDLCPFATIWRHWGLAGYNPI